jgi:Bacterial Ig-like domain (group 3)/FG-GAP-like repeat
MVQVQSSNGIGVLRTRFGPGTYSLTAHYNENNLFGASESSGQPLTVSGTEPTVSTLSVTQDGQNYDFSLSVSGSGNAPLSGTATLNNLSLNGLLLGNIPVPVGTSTFLPKSSYGTGLGPVGVVVADFNGDGFLDIAVTNNLAANVGVLLGNGNGTFQGQGISPTGAAPTGIAAWDFNADGVIDLAVANATDGNVSILKGTGQGTFTQTTASLGPVSSPFALVVGDFNNDGKADLAVTDTANNGVWILLGNGDGTFRSPTLYSTGSDPMGIAVGDFDGNGNADLAVTNFHDATVSVLLGKGDGTFSTQQTYSTGSNPQGIAVADFTLDGKLDLVVANLQDDTVSVLMGNGDGTFQTQQTHPTGSLPYGVVVADFNGDGFPDIAVTNSADAPNNSLSVLLNDTQGSFETQQTYPVGVNAYGIAAGDFDGNGAPDLATANNGDNTTSVLLGDTVATGQLNNIQVCGVGTQNIQSNFSPDGTFYSGSFSNVVSVVGCRSTTTTTVAGLPNPSLHLQPVNFTASVSVPPGSPAPSGTMTFTDTFNGVQTTLCAGTPLNRSGMAVCSTTVLACGTHSQLVASYSGDQNYLPSNGTDNPPQVVTGCGDFALLPISPGSVQITQTYNNNNDPFFAQTINVTVQPVNGYSGTVSLSCSVSPKLTDGSCTVNPPSSGSLAAGNLNTTLTISVGGSTPVCDYTVTVQAQDASGLVHSASLALGVVYLSPPVTMPTGGVAPPTQVSFWGLSGVIINNISCPLVAGTGIPGSEDLGAIGGVCSFSPTMTTLRGTCGALPGTTMLTITGCTVARLRMRTRIYASLWLGIPGLVLLGSFGKKSRRGKKVLRILAILLPILILLVGIGCGGVGQTTPSGSYKVLVQGTGTDGNVYSAVVPVTVTPLGQ